jgi:ATP-binding cassette subfamily B protein
MVRNYPEEFGRKENPITITDDWIIRDTVASIAEVGGIAGHFFKLIDQPEERQDGDDYSNVSDVSITFDSVSFSYSAEFDVLSGCSFIVPKASTVALVGGSGSGKTTIFKLICGYYEEYSGDVKIGGGRHLLK